MQDDTPITGTQAPEPLCDILSFLFSVLLSQGSMQEDKVADKGALQPQVSVWVLSECIGPTVSV